VPVPKPRVDCHLKFPPHHHSPHRSEDSFVLLGKSGGSPQQHFDQSFIPLPCGLWPGTFKASIRCGKVGSFFHQQSNRVGTVALLGGDDQWRVFIVCDCLQVCSAVNQAPRQGRIGILNGLDQFLIKIGSRRLWRGIHAHQDSEKRRKRPENPETHFHLLHRGYFQRPVKSITCGSTPGGVFFRMNLDKFSGNLKWHADRWTKQRFQALQPKNLTAKDLAEFARHGVCYVIHARRPL
jgi:hypothetical protein